MRNKLLLFVFICVFSSCEKSKFHNEKSILIDFLSSDNYLENKRCLVLIPANGCGSCTQDIKEYLKLNYKKNKKIRG